MRRKVNDIKPLVRCGDTHGWIRWHGQCKNCLKVAEQAAACCWTHLLLRAATREMEIGLVSSLHQHRLLRYWQQRFWSVQNCHRKIYVFSKSTIRTFCSKVFVRNIFHYYTILVDIAFFHVWFWAKFCANIGVHPFVTSLQFLRRIASDIGQC